MKNNTVLAIAAICNAIKDITVVAIFSYLAYYFNNIWIVLFSILFMGGINVRFSDKEEETRKGDSEDGE